MKTTKERKENMSTTKRNRKQAAAGAEAPHRSVQSANRIAQRIGGCAEYRRRTAALLIKVCGMFGGRVVEVVL